MAFSGESAQREQENLYELRIDRMLLNSKDRPKVDGLPVPLVGILDRHLPAIRQLRDAAGFQHLLQRDRPERPEVRAAVRIRRRAGDGAKDPAGRSERGRARSPTSEAEQLECRRKAHVEGVLPRDRTDYIIRCLAE